MPYDNLMSNTAMTTPTPLSQSSRKPPAMSNQRMPRQPMNTNMPRGLPPSVLAQAQQLSPQRQPRPANIPTLPSGMVPPQLPQIPRNNQMSMAQQANMVPQASLAPVQQPLINPITGQEMTEEEYQQMFGQMMPPGMGSNQLMPQMPQQTNGLQSVATQPRIF